MEQRIVAQFRVMVGVISFMQNAAIFFHWKKWNILSVIRPESNPKPVNMAPTQFKSVAEVLVCDNLNESYRAVVICCCLGVYFIGLYPIVNLDSLVSERLRSFL